MLTYHLWLSLKSLRRNPWVSAAMLLALAMGAGLWTTSIAQFVRYQTGARGVSAHVYQVEVRPPRDVNAAFEEDARESPFVGAVGVFARTQMSWPDASRVAASTVPTRISLGVRADVLVQRAGTPPQVATARFTNADFFALVGRPFAAGGPWPAHADRRTADEVAPVVLGRQLAAALFPRGGAMDQLLIVDGRSYRVSGVLAKVQPLNAPWQLSVKGGTEDALFLPLAEMERLAVRPNQIVYRSPVGPSRAELFASDARFVNLWVELPTPAQVAAFEAELGRAFGPTAVVLRDLGTWRRDFPLPSSQLSFFGLLGLIVLLGGGFNLSRWTLVRGLTRSAELGVFRALGASRSQLFARIVLEGLLLAVPAALLGPLVALPVIAVFNARVRLVDMPLELDALTIVIGVVPSLVSLLLGALYPAWRLSRTPPTVSLSRA